MVDAGGRTTAATRDGLVLSSRLVARNTLFNLVGQVLPLAVAAATLPLVVRHLGAAQFGLLALGWMVLGYAGELGFGRATTKFTAEVLGRGEHHLVPSLVWSTLYIQLGLGVAGGAALALAAPVLAGSALSIPVELQPAARQSMLVLAAGIPILLLSAALRGLLEAAQRFDIVNIVRIPATAALYLLPLVGTAVGAGLPGIFAMMVAAKFVAGLAFLYGAVRVFPGLGRPAGVTAEMGRLVRFGCWTALSSLAAPVLLYLDRIVLGVLVGVAAVGYYAPPFEVAVRLSIVPAALVTTLFPAFSMLAGRQEVDRIERAMARSIRYILLGMGPLAIVMGAAAGDLIGFWLGAEFAQQAVPAFRILLVGVVLNGVAFVPFTLIQAMGRPDLTARLQLAQLPVFAALAWALIGAYGITGAALAWTIRTGVDALLLLYVASRLRSCSPAGLLAGRVPQTAVLLGACAVAVPALVAAGSGPLDRLLLLGAGVGLCLPVIWHFGLAAADRSDIRQLLHAGKGVAQG